MNLLQRFNKAGAINYYILKNDNSNIEYHFLIPG